MNIILKVIRCNQYNYRLGVHLPVVNLAQASAVSIISNGNEVECDIRYVNRYNSFISKQVRELIRNVNMQREAGEPIGLLVFDMVQNGNNYQFTYLGPSIYKKIPKCRKYILDDNTEHTQRFSSVEEEIRELGRINV